MFVKSAVVSFVFCLWIIIDFLKIEKDIFKAMLRQFIFCNGPTIWLLRGEGVWVISEKNIIQTDFEGKKFLVRKCPAKIFLQWKKIPFMAYNAGKKCYTVACLEKILSPEVWGKKILPQTKPPLPPTPPPPPRLPQNSNGIAAFDFVFMLRQRRTKENKAANQNLRYVIYNIYIKCYILRQEIELGK